VNEHQVATNRAALTFTAPAPFQDLLVDRSDRVSATASTAGAAPPTATTPAPGLTLLALFAGRGRTGVADLGLALNNRGGRNRRIGLSLIGPVGQVLRLTLRIDVRRLRTGTAAAATAAAARSASASGGGLRTGGFASSL
jgi:hypothetical protein